MKCATQSNCEGQHERQRPQVPCRTATYDALGNRLTLTDPEDNTTTSTYDNVNRLLTYAQGYSAVGNRTSLAVELGANDDFLNSYTYDNLQRLTSVTQETQSGGNTVASKRVDFAYNALGQFTDLDRYASLDTSEFVANTSYTYDLANRLTSLQHARGLTALAGYDYTYDAANRITSIDSHLDGLSEYTYDNAGQLSDADHASQPDECYAYDDNGNRIGGDYDTDPNNLTVEDDDYTYGYDDEGNRVLRTDKTTGDYIQYTWDHRNRLTLVTFKNSSNTTTKQVAYEYDAFDRRVRKRVDTDGNSSWDRGEQYVYDGAHIALQFDDSGDLTRRNLFGPAIDQILASEFIGSPNDTHWYFADHLGTIRDVYSYDDVLNDLVSEGHLEYDSFGNVIDGAAMAEEAHFGYTAREWDADAELFYYRHRWYDAKLGQFISQDPIGFVAGDASLRRYVFGSPVCLLDPSGLADWLLPWESGASWNPVTTVQLWISHSPAEHVHGLWTGNTESTPETEAALYEDGADYYINNAGDTHSVLQSTGVLGTVVSGALQALEGEEAHNMVMEGGRLTPPPGQQGNAFPRPPAENAGQAVTEAIHDYGPLALFIVGIAEQLMPCENFLDGVCFLAGTEVIISSAESEAHAEQAGFTSPFAAASFVIAVGTVWMVADRRVLSVARRRRERLRPGTLSSDGESMATGKEPMVETDIEQPALRGDNQGHSSFAAANRHPAKANRGLAAASIIAAALLLFGCLFFLGGVSPGILEPSSVGTSQVSLPIEEIQVGQRVYVEGVQDTETNVDPDTWRRIRMKTRTKTESGLFDEIHIETLQSPEWVAQHDVKIGQAAPIPVDLIEMGLPADLRATVVANEPCPAIMDLPGRVVTTTIAHLNNCVMRLDVRSADLHEPIFVTAYHKFYSVDRGEFVSTEELRIGERLSGMTGDVTVASCTPLSGIHRVFNFTVEHDHTYRVSKLGVLVHNNDCWNFAKEMQEKHPDGVPFIMENVDSRLAVGDLPGYPVVGQPDAPFDNHVFLLENGVFFDPAHPNGVPIDQWLQQLGNRNHVPPQQVQDFWFLRHSPMKSFRICNNTWMRSYDVAKEFRSFGIA